MSQLFPIAMAVISVFAIVQDLYYKLYLHEYKKIKKNHNFVLGNLSNPKSLMKKEIHNSLKQREQDYSKRKMG